MRPSEFVSNQLSEQFLGSDTTMRKQSGLKALMTLLIGIVVVGLRKKIDWKLNGKGVRRG